MGESAGFYYSDVMNKLGYIENRINEAFGSSDDLTSLGIRVTTLEGEMDTQQA
jgi:hypothetical protein